MYLLIFQVERGEDERNKRELIVVSNVVDPSAANRAGVKEVRH